MTKRNNILVFPGQNSFIVNNGDKANARYNNMVNENGSYVPVIPQYDNTSYETSTWYKSRSTEPRADYLNSGAAGGGGGAVNVNNQNNNNNNEANLNNTNIASGINTFIKPIKNNILATATPDNQNATVQGQNSGVILANNVANNNSGQQPNKSKAFSWLPIIIGAAVLVAAGGVYMLVKK